jgi:bacteriocin-like protein
MKNKSKSPVIESIKNTSEEVPVELFELSDEDLQQIVGGLSLWDAITGAYKGKAKAVGDVVVGIVTTGSIPTDKETINNLLDPLPINVLRRLAPKWFPW